MHVIAKGFVGWMKALDIPNPFFGHSHGHEPNGFLVLADSTAHGFRDVGIYGSKQVYIVCCGGSLLLGRRGHERSAILQQLVCQWQFVQEQLGGCSLSSPVQMCAIPGRDSVAQEGYDELGALRDHFQIAEGQKTINSYGCEIDGWELYGKREGGKTTFSR